MLCLSVSGSHLPTGTTRRTLIVCGDPESGTDHSLKEVHALFGIGWTQHWGSCHKDVCAIVQEFGLKL